MKKLILLLCLTLPLSGCSQLLPIDWSKVNQSDTQTSSEVNSEIVAKIKAASKDIPEADRITLYKMYAGYASFIKSAIPQTTASALENFGKVREIYGWQVDKYPEFGKAQKEILTNEKYTGGVNYAKPQKLSDVGENLHKIVLSIAEGLK